MGTFIDSICPQEQPLRILKPHTAGTDSQSDDGEQKLIFCLLLLPHMAIAFGLHLIKLPPSWLLHFCYTFLLPCLSKKGSDRVAFVVIQPPATTAVCREAVALRAFIKVSETILTEINRKLQDHLISDIMSLDWLCVHLLCFANWPVFISNHKLGYIMTEARKYMYKQPRVQTWEPYSYSPSWTLMTLNHAISLLEVSTFRANGVQDLHEE